MREQQSWTLWGGGLANCLLALRLHQNKIPFCLIERSSKLAGEHTWSFHEADLEPADLDFVKPMITRSWPGYSVHFKGYDRHFKSGYFTIRSEDLRKTIGKDIPAECIQLNCSSDKRPAGELVIDARGFAENQPVHSGWQKFVGWDIRFAEEHGQEEPVIMDATVEQIDGFRFVYILPLDSHTLLVEDTRYSNSPTIDEKQFAKNLSDYIENRWPHKKWSLERQEMAALPIPLRPSLSPDHFGVSGGFFHPVTGYSLPYAVRISRQLIDLVKRGQSTAEAWKSLQRPMASNQKYFIQLNRMMFLAAQPQDRWKIFDRFYRLDKALIDRFYSGRSNSWDKFRIVAGKPPVPINKALRALFSKTEQVPWN